MYLFLELLAAFIFGMFYTYSNRLDRTKTCLLKASKISEGKGIGKIYLESGIVNNLNFVFKILLVVLFVFSFWDSWKNGLLTWGTFLFTYAIFDRLNVIPNQLEHYLDICFKSAHKVALVKAKGKTKSLVMMYDADLEFIKHVSRIYMDLTVDVPSLQFIKEMKDGELFKLREEFNSSAS